MRNDQLVVLAIDDQPVNLKLIKALAAQMDFSVVTFLDPLDAVNYTYSNTVDIVLTDYMMPNMNGIEVVKYIRNSMPELPVVIITAVGDDPNIKLEALQSGATDFLTKPINVHEFQARLNNLAELRKAHIMLKDRAKMLQHAVENATGSIRAREHEALHLLANASEQRDKETGKHVLRVANYSKLIAERIGEDDIFQDMIFFAAPLHDIGKLGVSDVILNKPGKLTEDEITEMQRHPQLGHNLLKDGKSPYIVMGAEVALTHHERYDGSGYPAGLAAEQIPLSGRIVCLADVFDALISKRPYKDAWHVDEAFANLREESGKMFDPEIVEAFCSAKDEVLEIVERLAD